MTLELLAPAKLNLTLEVLGKRDDGYHEIVSVMQTIDLADTVVLSHEDNIQLFVDGPEAGGLPKDPAQNLAYRAAEALRDEVGRPELGVRVHLTKRVPSGAGLGGGSSDAAAVLRSLNRLWELDFTLERLEGIAASLGSDVPFFLHGGTALVKGRGEIVQPLPDLSPGEVTLLLPSTTMPDKTAGMYARVTPLAYTSGGLTRTVAQSIRDGVDLMPSQLCNVFDRYIPAVSEVDALLRGVGLRVVSTGSGPGLFSLQGTAMVPRALLQQVESFGYRVVTAGTLTRDEALAVWEI